MAVNDATYNLSFHEILTKVNNAKDKPKKLEVLQKYDTNELRMFLKGAFDDKLEWLLPEGSPPYTPNEAPVGTEHTWLKQEVKRMFHFLKGGNPQLSQAGSLVSEGGGLVGDAGSVVEKVRTVRTSDDLAEAITDGVVLAARGAQFGAKVNMLVQ